MHTCGDILISKILYHYHENENYITIIDMSIILIAHHYCTLALGDILVLPSIHSIKPIPAWWYEGMKIFNNTGYHLVH